MKIPRVWELVEDSRHAGPLDGASRLGRAAGGDRLQVWIGLWLDGAGRVERARFRATSCASLIACAEAACRLAEQGAGAFPAERLLEAVAGLHPGHRDRARIVAAALARAWDPRSPHPAGAPP